MITTKLFNEFFKSEKSAGIILIICSIISLVLANSFISHSYINFWQTNIISKPLEFWINDGLMTIFFLLVGLEIEREIYIGELSNLKKSLLPVFAAVGGMLFPALIHFSLNQGTYYRSGFGIPMATDIAFTITILSLLGKRIPTSLKVFLTALAIIDDLGAIAVIALFYSKNFSIIYFTFAIVIFFTMIFLNRVRYQKIWIYIILGVILWLLMYQTGIHPTITGVLLAFAIPFGNGDEKSPSFFLQHFLHKPVAFFILPIFALANTAIIFPSSLINSLTNSNSYGIILGLLFGKPLGIFIFSLLGVFFGLCSFPDDIKRIHIFGAGLLAGIGFTMSIFITLLAFTENSDIIDSKIAVLAASVLAAVLGYILLRKSLRNTGLAKN